MRRDSSCSSGGKTEDSLGRACVGPPRDDAKAHRTWDRGRRSSSSSSSTLTVCSHCTLSFYTVTVHCRCKLGAIFFGGGGWYFEPPSLQSFNPPPPP